MSVLRHFQNFSNTVDVSFIGGGSARFIGGGKLDTWVMGVILSTCFFQNNMTD
jgi:hypothetical protein